MDLRNGLLELIGNTPLVKLQGPSEATGCTILGKCEFLNPGGSVKDRAGLYIVKDAIAKGKVKEGGIFVEGTAGNTGIGIALVANTLGYRSVIVMNETLAREKMEMLRLCGARVELVPQKPYRDPDNYIRYSGRLAEHLNRTDPKGAVWANQFDNLANRQAHYETTGPEIWRQTEGRLDAFICAIGTGGTLSGVGLYLKEKKPNVVIGLADPMGAAMYSYFTTGELKSEGDSITEGIGQGRVTKNVDGTPVDKAYRIPDEEALPVLYDLVQKDGLVLGGSSAVNVAGAIRLAREMGPGHTIVTVLCDHGTRYVSKVYNPDFLRSKNLPVPPWLDDPAGLRKVDPSAIR